MGDLKNFLDEQGRLKLFPAKRGMKLLALAFLAEKFEADVTYSERQVNDLLNGWHTFNDPATLRRELYDFHFLDRTADGKAYRLSEPQPQIM